MKQAANNVCLLCAGLEKAAERLLFPWTFGSTFSFKRKGGKQPNEILAKNVRLYFNPRFLLPRDDKQAAVRLQSVQQSESLWSRSILLFMAKYETSVNRRKGKNDSWTASHYAHFITVQMLVKSHLYYSPATSFFQLDNPAAALDR